MHNKPQVPTIESALGWAGQQGLMSLDTEILLAHVLQVSRAHLHAWPERKLTESEQAAFSQVVSRRVLGEPIAYITGHREFWSLDLQVTSDTLIPRPETELLVELVLEKFPTREAIKVADLGTGSGAIALALAHERPAWEVHASDLHAAALAVAEANAQRLKLKNLSFHQGSWCNALPKLRFDAIISNPPYIAKDDSELNQDVIEFEPHQALFSAEGGLRDIREIVNSAKNYLKSGGWLLIEHGYRQAKAVESLFAQAGYTDISVHRDIAGLDRVTTGSFP